MFVSEDLIFLELQKTGGSHILRLLSQLIGGESQGKHNRLDATHNKKFIIGSVRNPWDWYVSLWAYGVSGKGALRTRTHAGFDLGYYWRMLPKSMGKNWLSPTELVLAAYHDCFKPIEKWEGVYQDATSPKQFRDWLKLMLKNERKFDFGEGFAFSPISNHSGLMTYRYLRLFTLGDQIYSDKRLRHIDGLKEFDMEKNVAKAMIRNEHLEDDFIAALDKAGYPISPGLVDKIKGAGKTNQSKRKNAAFYYDNETLALVSEREQFIIEKYGYEPPVLETNF